MYVNIKMITVETSRNGVGVKKSDGGGEFKYGIFDTL
jgi:hypothetical protein